MEKLVLASGIILTCVAMAAFSPKVVKDKKSIIKREGHVAVDTVITDETKQETASSYTFSKSITSNDTLPEKEVVADSSRTLNFKGTIDGKPVQLKEENGKIKELYVDGKKIPENQYDEYRTLVDKIYIRMKETAARLKLQEDDLKQKQVEMQKQAEQMNKEAEKMKEQSILMQKEFKDREEEMKQRQVEMQKQAELMNKNDTASFRKQARKMQGDLMRQMEEFKIKQMEFQKKVEQLNLQQQQLKEMIRDSLKIKSGSWKPAVPGTKAETVKYSVKPTAFEKPVATVRVTKTISTASKIKLAPAVSVKPTAFEKPVISVTTSKAITAASNVKLESAVSVKPATEVIVTKGYSSSRSISEDIIRELENANIITTDRNLSFVFTNDELIVNDVKQPAELHQKLLKKYVTKPSETISLNYSNKQ